MKRQVGLGLLWLLLATLASAPLWLSFPEPDAQTIRQITHIGPQRDTVTPLPLTGAAGSGRQHYRLAFQFDPASAPQYLLIPILSQHARFEIAGQTIGDTRDRIAMVGMASGMPALIQLPSAALQEGRNVVDLYLHSEDLMPTGLSRLYVGSAEQLGPYYRLRVFLLEYLRFMVLAAQILITLVVGVLWLYRPSETLFGWLFFLLLMSMVLYLGMAREWIPHFATVMPYAVLVGTSASLALLVIMLLIAGRPPPRWLTLSVVVVPSVSVLPGLTGLVSVPHLVLFLGAPLNVLSMLAATVLLIWAALVRGVEEAWLLLLPVLVMTVTGGHDLAVLLGQLSTPILLSMYYRPLMLIGIAMILMRRLGISLTRLDHINSYLKRKLQQRETQLARLHNSERHKAIQQTRQDERARLTADLHDGLSGHLASIIALSERENSQQVEHAAREALDDLRLVVQSLDINDRELTLALAGLRERLDRQLKRIGVRLEWSTAWLPDIDGVTPSHALNVLRILQEAVTNAIQHGNASLITVRGDAHQGRARIIVENDGLPFPHHPNRGGNGLQNMRRRIRQLRGDIYIEPLASGTRLSLLLPLHLSAAPGEKAP